MKVILVVLFTIFLLSGCSRMNEPKDLAYVVATGIDPSDKEGNYEITLQIANPIAISGGSSEEGGEGGEKTISEITVEAPTIYSAVNIANHLNSKKLILSHNALIVICDEIAKEGITEYAETLGRSEQMRPNTYITVVHGKSKEYLSEIKPTNEVNPVQYYSMIFDANYASFVPKVKSQEFYTTVISGYRGIALPLSAVYNEENPKPEVIYDGFEFLAQKYIAGSVEAKSDEKTQTYGMAIISDGKMVAEADAIEAELLNMMQGRYFDSEVSYKQDENSAQPITVVQSQQRRPKIKVTIRDTKPQISAKVFIEADLRTVSHNYVVEEKLDEFEKNAASSIKEALEKFLNRTATEYKTDIVGFADYARKRFKSYDDFQKYDWQSKYPDAEFDITVDFHIRRSGLVDKSKGE